MLAKEIAQKLASKAQEIAQYLYPNGQRRNNEWCVGNIEGDRGDSLKIHLSGSKTGIWCDFATGEKGDLLDLWAIYNHISIKQAMYEASEYLGLQQPKITKLPIKKQYSKPSQKKGAFSYAIENYLCNKRLLEHSTLIDFNIYSKENDVVFPYIKQNEVKFIKYLNIDRIDGKKKMSVEPNCEPILFGWHVIEQSSLARQVVICEGEIDAMTLYQYGFNALSLPLGAGTGKRHEWIDLDFDSLSAFDEIYLCLDNDSVGLTTAKELADRLGLHRCKIVQLPYKDANECLQKGLTCDEMHAIFKKAFSLDPEELCMQDDFTDNIINKLYPIDSTPKGYSSPWSKFNQDIRFRPNELSVWSGINGHGKSQFLGNALLSMLNQGAKACIASLEMTPENLLARMYRQASAMRLPSPDYIREISKQLNNLWIFNLVGTANSNRLLEVFKYAYMRYGIDVFVIDSLMCLDIAEDDYKAQKAFIESLCAFKNSHPIHIHLIVHPRKPANEEYMGGKLDYKGTGAVSDLADNCFNIWRNKAKEHVMQALEEGHPVSDKERKELDKPDCILSCDKQRHGDHEGKFGFWFDKNCYQYLEYAHAKAKPFIHYSQLHSVN